MPEEEEILNVAAEDADAVDDGVEPGEDLTAEEDTYATEPALMADDEYAEEDDAVEADIDDADADGDDAEPAATADDEYAEEDDAVEADIDDAGADDTEPAATADDEDIGEDAANADTADADTADVSKIHPFSGMTELTDDDDLEDDFDEDDDFDDGIHFSLRDVHPLRAIRNGLKSLVKGIGHIRSAMSPRLAASLVAVAAVVIIAFAVYTVSTRWKYHTLRTVDKQTQEDTASSDYCSVNGNILRYGTDGATLENSRGEAIWTIAYAMASPRVVSRDDIVAIYDSAGSDIVIADKSGQIGNASSKLPITKADISATGTVAAIEENDANAWIEYYSPDGSTIAEIRTSIDNPGYPMDISLSDNGELLAVSYLGFTGGRQNGILHIYSFGAAGQNQMDNRIGDFETAGRIIPEVEYLGGSTFAAIGSDGFAIYEGDKIPKETAEVLVEKNIVSAFHDGDKIGLILEGGASEEESHAFEMRLYDGNGRQTESADFDFIYDTVEYADGEINLYNGSELCVLSEAGIEKFNGTYDESTSAFFAIGRHRFVAVTDNSMNILQLK